MTRARSKIGLLHFALLSALAIAATGSCGSAAGAPIKERLALHVGGEVDANTKGGVCTVESGGDTCQPGKESTAAGGFAYPTGVAADNDAGDVAHHGHLYVADNVNRRIQELTSTGQFVAMFGWDVNKTKVEEGAPQEARNVCTAASANTCQAGVSGVAPEQFGTPDGVSVDPVTGNVYVEDVLNWRVVEYTSGGRFLLMIGKHVNMTTGANLCTEHEVETESVQCGAGEKEPEGHSEHGAFNFTQGNGNQVTVGQNGTLYVGEEHRVQEFNSSGQWQDELPLGSLSSEPQSEATAIAVDDSGDLFLVYRLRFVAKVSHEVADMVYEFDPSHKEISPPFPLLVVPRDSRMEVQVGGLALDSEGRLAVVGFEAGLIGTQPFFAPLGNLYEVATGKLITEFAAGNGTGLTFDDAGKLFEAAIPPESGHELLGYTPVPVAELVTSSQSCSLGTPHESDATFKCTLNGEANPENVPGLEVWFQWGQTCTFGLETPLRPVSLGGTLEPVPPAELEGLRPNEQICYRLAGYDQNVKSPESPLSGLATLFVTSTVRPVIVGEPSASFVKAASVVFFGEVNPEHDETEYLFEYGPCPDLESCALKTQARNSAAYGPVGVALEATGLQPATLYHYRLVAVNEKHETGVNEQGDPPATGTFTTAPASSPRAMTGQPGAIGSTTATISGTVDPDGQAATYAFEVGIDKGAATQYGTVFLGSAGSGVTPLTKTYGLSGLQPGTAYSYRITLRSGEVSLQGAAERFETAGIPQVLVPPVSSPLLAMPSGVFFPKALVVKKVAKKTAKPKRKKAKKAKGKKVRNAVRKKYGAPRSAPRRR
jgi:hypothetical protein